MGIFSDNVRRYYEYGIITIPCRNKRPILGNEWERFCKERPTETTIDKWEKQFRDAPQLGLALGEASLISGFDFDYEYDEKKCTISKREFDKDRKLIEKQIISLLPMTPVIKTGKKGWTRIYRTNALLNNAQGDRNGLRLFDFLAKNKQTIIPPSKYDEGSDLFYKWIGEPIENCLDDIPFITQEIVDEIKMACADSKGGYDFDGNGRHGKLFRWLLDVIKLESSDERLISQLIDMDRKLNGTNAYLSDPKHFRSTANQPETNALAWIRRVRSFAGVTPKKIIAANQDGWGYFFANSFWKTKKDIISKDVFIKRSDTDDWQSIRGLENVLRAYAIETKLKHSQTLDHLERWIFEKQDLDFLCDMPEWDGVDRVDLLGKAIVTEHFDSSEIGEILKHWGANVFARVESSDVQNRCIILKGPQGIGKDHLVREMLRDFKPYYESTTLPGNQKDILEIVSRLLIVHIEEFDQTRNIDISFLKSLITQPSAFFRESYGFSPNKKIMRPSFISTANVDDFLRDPTGNRRFIVIPVSSINWDYPKGCSLQIMAQFKHHFEAGEFKVLKKSIEHKIKSIVDAYTPDDIGDMVIELYRHRYFAMVGIDGPYQTKSHLTYAEIGPVLLDIAKTVQCSLRRVQSIIKAKGFSKRDMHGVFYYGNAASKDRAP